MKVIRPTYRARFRQPQGALNPIGAKLTIPIEVEIFESSAGQWKARRPGTNAEFTPIPTAGSATGAQTTVREYFAEQLADWGMFHQGEPLETGVFITRDNGRVFLLEPEDFTHIQQQGKASKEIKNKAWAACGVLFLFDKFASYEAGSPPTCSVCRAHYDLVKRHGA